MPLRYEFILYRYTSQNERHDLTRTDLSQSANTALNRLDSSNDL